MTPQQAIDKMTDCSMCRGHDDHTQCETKYIHLQEWMESVEERLVDLQNILTRDMKGMP